MRHNQLISKIIIVVIIVLYMFSAFALSAKQQSNDNVRYFDISLRQLENSDTRLPVAETYQVWRNNGVKYYKVIMDCPAEVYVYPADLDNWNWNDSVFDHYRIAGKVTNCEGKLTGSLFLPAADTEKAVVIPFTVPVENIINSEADNKVTEARNKFQLAKERYYRELVNRNIAGTAWFRHQVREAVIARTGKPTDPDNLEANNNGFNQQVRTSEMEDTYAIFTGGRAMSENLQLDRLLQDVEADGSMIGVDTLPGITINEIDWAPLIEGKKPVLDRLSKVIPVDQYALLFPSFQSMLDLVDEITDYGTPVLRLLEPRSEDAGTKARYEKQLCLGIDYLIRMLGPKVVSSVAMTGSDPYLRTGSDVAILFEVKEPAVIIDYVKSKQLAVSQSFDNVKIFTDEIAGHEYTAAISDNREICSYVAQIADDLVVVSNSLTQLNNICNVNNGSLDSISSLSEFVFFRDRYKIGAEGETAFLMVTDAAIRKLCGPRWRIANSRRIRAAGLMAELQAEYLDKLVTGVDQAGPVYNYFTGMDVGNLELGTTGIYSSKYNTLNFMTPISEMNNMDKVTMKEAEAYRNWRIRYQNNWRQNFDPIGIRFSLAEKQVLLDITIIPLIQNSDYEDFTQFIGESKIPEFAGIRHKETLLNFIMAIDHNSSMFRSAGAFFMSSNNEMIKTNPFDWLGSTVSLYVEKDEFWQKLVDSEDPEYFIWEDYGNVPIIAQVDIDDTLKFTAFISAVRAMINQMMPDMLEWENEEYEGFTYTKVVSADEDDPSLYYAVKPGKLILTFREDILQKTLDRLNQKPDDMEYKLEPWPGESMCIDVSREALTYIEPLMYSDYNSQMQLRCWDNLLILNEWKRIFPDKDAVELHNKFWQTLLVCPGGGDYIWNDKWQTYESTVYGNPFEPKNGPELSDILKGITDGSFGLTFENQGLRAVTKLDREPVN